MKTALVTGASRGIGLAISKKLKENGFNVVGLSRKIEPGDPFAYTIRANVDDLGSHDSIVERVLKKFGRIDLLVNNAGVAPLKRMDLLKMTVESYDRVMNFNLRGPLFLTQSVARAMVNEKGQDEGFNPSIIFITSISAVTSSVERGEYCVSKAGLSMVSQLFADRLSAEGIPVYEIRPGIILTDMTEPVKDKYDRLIAKGLIPQGRWGQPEDIAKAALSLAGGAIPYATGTVIEMSGGMNIRHL
jgi:NAD(P)-dependent dehydrogenase (short-subunit alcohol dehydrogenase family)